MSVIKLITNILKVADVDSEDLSESIIKYLGGFVYYQDTILSEHIYSVADAIESDHFEKLTALDQFTLKTLHEQTDKEECAYVRVVYTSNKAVQEQEAKRHEPFISREKGGKLRRELKASGLKFHNDIKGYGIQDL